MQGRSTPRLIADTFGLYRRYPLLFLVLAAAVTGGGTLASAGAGADIALSLLDLAMVGPLVSALHVHAVSDVRQGEEPRIGPIAKRGLTALPVVSAATIMSSLGIVGGLLLFDIPGLILFIRWVVAAQAAALEHEGWSAALRSSRELTTGSRVHVVVFIVCTSLIAFVPDFLLGIAFDDDRTTVASFLTGSAWTSSSSPSPHWRRRSSTTTCAPGASCSARPRPRR